MAKSIVNKEENENVQDREESAVNTTAPLDKDAALEEANRKIEDLQMRMEMLMKIVTNQVNTPSVKDERVKIIHLCQAMVGLETTIELSNLVVHLTNFGEERYLTLQQFEELVGKYRAWFESGIIAVSNGYEKYAETYGVRMAKGFPINREFFKELGSLPITQIEDIFPKLPIECQGSVTSLWKRKVYDRDPQYTDIRKLETLNRLTNGAFTQLIAEENAKR